MKSENKNGGPLFVLCLKPEYLLFHYDVFIQSFNQVNTLNLGALKKLNCLNYSFLSLNHHVLNRSLSRPKGAFTLRQPSQTLHDEYDDF